MRVNNYAKAVTKWFMNGRPVRSDEEVQKLLDTCKNCEHYNAEKGVCKICGCNLNLSQNAMVNKLRMATENCPIGKW